MRWFMVVLRKYAVFSGRARRAEYWYFLLFYILISIGVTILDLSLGVSWMGLPSMIFALAMAVPSLAVSVRRLHDTDRSGWWALIAFIPVIGPIVLLALAALDGTPGENRFGPNPKGADGGFVPHSG